MTVTDASVTWLTQEAYDRLKAELEELIDNRPVIAAEINARREEGDLKENGGYHAAREDQGQQEARIRQLQELLRTAQVGTAPTSTDTVSPGMVLKIRYEGDDDTETVLLGSREEGVRGGLEVVSPSSPLGAALIGAHVGTFVRGEYAALGTLEEWVAWSRWRHMQRPSRVILATRRQGDRMNGGMSANDPKADIQTIQLLSAQVHSRATRLCAGRCRYGCANYTAGLKKLVESGCGSRPPQCVQFRLAFGPNACRLGRRRTKPPKP